MHVLIADDNKDMTASLALLLREWKFEPVEANDGTAALTLLRAAAAPALAVLDWIMPGVNGIDICRALRQETARPYTYIILMTGRGGKEQMLDGLKAGADDYLIKPVDPNELHARLTTGKRILDLQQKLLSTQRLLREQATRDGLTGLWNRPAILEILQRELAQARREGLKLTLILADVDHFKDINDTFGHLVGDQVLRETAQRLLAALRPYDTVGRYGGEEFLIVLPGCDAEVSLGLAERLRRSVEAKPTRTEGRTIAMTISLGLAAWDGQVSPQELLRRADEAMYRAKGEGRNRAAL